jgi:hypothetical protein
VVFGIFGEPFKKATTRPSPERPWPPPDGAILPEDDKLERLTDAAFGVVANVSVVKAATGDNPDLFWENFVELLGSSLDKRNYRSFELRR